MDPTYTPGEPIPDVMRLDLGAIIVDRFLDVEEDAVTGTPYRAGFNQEECTEWLHNLGFERVEWAQPTDHILWLSLWRSGGRHGGMLDEFVLEFAGQDSLVVSLFNFVGQRVL